MAMDLSGAPQEQGVSLIPENTLAWATVNVRPKAADMGVIAFKGKTSPENRYLDLEIEITSGKSTGRKVYHKLCVGGSEKWHNMGLSDLRHILEVGRQWSPGNPQVYMIGVNLADNDERMYMDLDGLQCAVRVGIEPGKDGFKDKNSIKEFLSPHPDSPTHKMFLALVAGETSFGKASTDKPAPNAGGNAWQQTAGQQAPPNVATPPAAPAARPTWAGAPPPANNAGGKIPF